MNEYPDNSNCIYRALNPRMAFEKPDGSISSAAFKDKKGLSVEQQMGRMDTNVAEHMMSYLNGNIAKIRRVICGDCDVIVQPKPLNGNEFHCLLLNSNRTNDENLSLTNSQAKYLARHIDTIIKTNPT